MALLRKFFYRKPSEGLLEISERVYVFDCCFAVDVLGDDKYRDYVGGVVTKLRDYFPDGSFVVFNFLDGKNHSRIADILAEYDITVMDYPRQYENCPLLTLEMIHRFLKSSESWLDHGGRNILLLHCERGGWTVLVFSLAAFLIHRKQYTGEQRTLDMIYKQAPRQLLQLVSPLNPLPSQLRYLQYISGRNLHPERPPLVRALMLDCIILKVLPTMDAEGGCCPIFRIYGLDPVMEADQIPKMLLSTQKSSKVVHHYKQADSDLVKIDINCHIKGDVVLECITLDHELQLEKTMFRIIFNTAFIKSNMLILTRVEIDTLWNVLDNFSRDFRVEVLFSEMDYSTSECSLHSCDLPVVEDERSSWFEAHAQTQGVRTDVDKLRENAEAERNMLKTQENLGRVLAPGKDNVDDSSSQSARIEILESCSPEVAKEENEEIVSTLETRKSNAMESDMSNSYSKVLEEQGTRYSGSLVSNSRKQKTQSEELQAASLRTVQSKIVSPRILQGSLSSPASFSLQESSSSISRYQKTRSALGITALLHDTSANNKVGSHVVTLSPRPSLSASFPQLCKPTNPSLLSLTPPSELRPPSPVATSSPAPPPPLSPSAPLAPSKILLKSGPQSFTCDSSASKQLHSPQKFDSNTVTQDTGYSGTASCPSPPPFPHSGMSPSLTVNNSISPPPPPLPVFTRRAASVPDSFTSSIFSPPIPPSSSSSNLVPTTTMKNASILPPVHKIASSTNSVPDKSSDLETSSFMPSSPSLNSVSDSNNTVKSSSSPSSVVFLTSSSSNQSPSSPTNCSCLSTTTITPPFSDLASSSGQISLIAPEKNLEITPLPSVHIRSLSISSATALPQPAPPAQSQPSHSLSEALSPIMNSCSTLPASLGMASLSGSISSLLPYKSSKTVARPPQPPPPPPSSLNSRALSNSAATSAPQPAPPAESQPLHSLREAPSPVVNSCSNMPESPGVASLSASISSLLPEKSSETVARPPQPPPTSSLHSRAVSNSASSAPPPPAPPSCPPKESIARISPRIPPPPAPFSCTLPKAGANLQFNSCGRHGNVPPTPAPPVGAKGRLQSSPVAKPQSQTKKSSLKPYHWLKLTRALHGSIWAETQKPEEASKTPEFDMSELECLFSANVLNSDHGSTKGMSNRASKSKSDKVNLIEFRRAYNCEIMLTKIKIPLPDIMSSVLSLDDSALDADQVENLIKFCPTKEEMELLMNYNGDIENLGKCEQFLLEMMKVPRAESKLRVFSFKIQFQSRVSDLRGTLNLVNSTSEEVRNSVKLKRVMQTILSLGNALNHGTARGSAIGFRLDSLLKLSDTRARNNKMTLMHYLCKVLAEKLPELLDFPRDLMSLEAATRMQLKYLAEEMQAISKGLEKVAQELTASQNDGPVSDSFCKTVMEFLHFADAEVRSLASLYSVVGRNADALAQYFGEDPARCPFEQVISTLLNFVRLFVKAHMENCKQLEVEKKRAQKDAENERANLTIFTTEPDENKLRANACNVSKHSIQHR